MLLSSAVNATFATHSPSVSGIGFFSSMNGFIMSVTIASEREAARLGSVVRSRANTSAGFIARISSGVLAIALAIVLKPSVFSDELSIRTFSPAIAPSSLTNSFSIVAVRA